MTITPIWKTIEVDMTSGLSSGAATFAVKIGSNTIYEGKAYADPNGNCIVTLNGILKDYLGTPAMTLTGQTYADTKAVQTFTVTYGTSGSTTIKVLNDWSYDPARSYADNSPAILTDAAYSRWDYHAIRPFTIIGASSYSWVLKNTSGTTISSGSRTISGNSETFFCQPTAPGTLFITIGSHTYSYKIGNYCDAGAFVYRNKIGGFDTIPIASFVNNEEYTRESYDIAGNNWNPQTHLRRDFRADVRRTITLRTPALSDAEAAVTANAVGSVQAWLYSADHNYEAVVVKATAWKHKTFRNEGQKRVVYEFEVEFAQPMERR